MIKKIHIENFKCFDSLDISNLYNVTILGGVNNIGKTSILEALFLFFDRLHETAPVKPSLWRGVQGIKMEPRELWGPIFSKYDMEKEIVITVTDENNDIERMKLKINKNFRPGMSTGDSIKKEMETETLLTAGQKSVSALDVTVLHNEKPIQSSHFVIMREDKGNRLSIYIDNAEGGPKNVKIRPANYVNPNEDAVLYGQLDLAGRQNVILDFLKKIEPNLKGISVIALGEKMVILHGDIGNGRKIPIPYMGGGMQRMLSIILAIATSENGLVLIDEVENGLHYSVLPSIWKGISAAAREFNCQVMATTHSDECIKAALTGFESDKDSFGYIRIDRDKKGVFVIKNYPYSILQASIDRNWEIR